LKLYKALFVIFFLLLNNILVAQNIYPKKEYAATLHQLADALLKRQMKDATNPDFGGIWCEHCHVWHTRAAEAVFPFTVMYLITKDKKYFTAAKNAASWLIKQQQPNGSWKETPEEWTGTTTDQLLMLLLSYEKISTYLDDEEKNTWKSSMKKAADYLESVMRPEFASINYVATTTATLAKAGTIFNNESYLLKAKELAHRAVSKMDDDGFLNGEGGKSHGNKMGVDLGYDMEMSLWGLGLYAKITNDTLVNNAVKRALKNHLYFIYPDGSMDGSWGIRSNKWTGYGSATSDGCQALFSLYADIDPRYSTASIKNLQFLRKNIQDDLIGYGLQHGEIFDTPPCIYPTFAKAKNLALAYELENKEMRSTAELPSDKTGWIKLFPTLDVIEVRTKNFMATITGYRYKDQVAGSRGKYMYRPTGGSVSHVWLKGQGFLQASSPTVYTRPEPMSFPEAPGVLSLTPRIEYTDTAGYFTNLFEFDSRLAIEKKSGNQFSITATGELKDKNWLTGGVGYKIDYLFADNFFQKTIRITYHDAWPVVKIIEPFINFKGMRFEKKDDKNVIIQNGQRKLLFSIISGAADLITGRNKDKFWTPYPALKAYPLELEIKPASEKFTSSVTYRITILN
jgi:hypothetical protein